MQHPLKSTQSLNIDWDKPKLLNGAKNQLLFCKNPEKPKTYCLRRTSDSLVVLHRPVEPAAIFGNWVSRLERAENKKENNKKGCQQISSNIHNSDS